MKKTIRFLGSIYFAIFLIVLAALYVVAGTFVESLSRSHLYAKETFYTHPFFLALLSLFFVNILLSALNRWPFKLAHIPFLLTHLGLLLVILGLFAKTLTGASGVLVLKEGTSSDEILQPTQKAVHVVDREGNRWQLPSKKGATLEEEDFRVELVDSFPHHEVKHLTWIKGGQLQLLGLDPLPLQEKTQVKLEGVSPEKWQIASERTDQMEELLESIALAGLEVMITDRRTGNRVVQKPLSDFTEEELTVHFPSDNKATPNLTFHFKNNDVVIPLSGPRALINHPQKRVFQDFGLAIDLKRTPTLWFIEDQSRKTQYALVLGPHGQLRVVPYPENQLSQIVVYDEGFGGVHAELTINDDDLFSREEKEALVSNLLKSSTANAILGDKKQLPFALFQTPNDFEQAYSHLRKEGILKSEQLNLEKPLQWNYLDQRTQRALYWAHFLRRDFQEQLDKGVPLDELMNRPPWRQLLVEKSDLTSGEMTNRLFQVADKAPEGVAMDALDEADQKEMALDYLSLFDIQEPLYHALESRWDEPKQTLETPLAVVYTTLPQERAFEDNLELAVVSFQEGNNEAEQVALGQVAGQSSSKGLKRVSRDGGYLLSLETKALPIPYRLKLQEVTVTAYPGFKNPRNYEAIAQLTDQRTGESEEIALSMNQVYETWDGFRFYLSSMTPQEYQGSKTASIIVNHDPAKYYLTYPGAILLALGVVLLLFFNPYDWNTPFSKKRGG